MMRLCTGFALLTALCIGAGACNGGDDDDSAAVGSEGGACFPNNTCNKGLSCFSKLCVNDDEEPDAGPPDPSPAGTGKSGSGGRGGTGGSGEAGSPVVPSADVSCFGTSPDEVSGAFNQCVVERCCGSSVSCFKDESCKSTFKCAASAASQAEFDACTDPLEATEMLASRLWFLDFFSCASANCFGEMIPNAKPKDPCEQYKDCRACLNGGGLMSGGATGNCGWMTDDTCHAGSTSGPDDPAAWGNDLKWTFFDDANCPGGVPGSSGGCTADADCGRCERCERSTGKCLTRLTCN